MTPQEIYKQRIEEAAIKYSCSNPSEHENGMYDQSDLEWAYEAGATYALQHQWISVEEALPEDKTKVFVIVKTPVGIVHRADYHINDYWYMSRYSPEEIVTHWMAIPQLKGGEE
jgi:hypothetical protein